MICERLYIDGKRSLNIHHVYMVLRLNDGFEEIVYIGQNTLAGIVRLDDLIKLPAFEKNLTYSLCVLTCHKREFDAKNAVGPAIRIICENRTPIYNIRSSYNARRSGIICNETGKTFKTVTEAAREMGLSQGNLSQHVSGRPGFRQVKGYTFKWIEQPVQSIAGYEPIFFNRILVDEYLTSFPSTPGSE